MHILVDEEIERGQRLALCLTNRNGEELRVDGEVVWVGEGSQEHPYSVGIYFAEHHGNSWERLQQIEDQSEA